MKFGLRELVFFLLLLALPFSAYIWVFKPANAYIQERQQTLETHQQKLEKCRQANNVIEDLNQELDRYQQAVNFFDSKLPSHHEIHRVLDGITKIAQRHRLETRLFKTMKTEPFARCSEQPIRMEIYGEFDAFYEFLLDVEKMPRITKIKQMHLEQTDGSLQGHMEARLTMSIFFDNGTSDIG